MVNMSNVAQYHAHIYFELDDLARTEQIRQKLIDSLPAQTVVYKLIARLVGPHTLPMFEIDFPTGMKDQVVSLIEQYRDGRSVLIHPVIDDELAAHTSGAQWLGRRLDLLLDRL